MLKDIIVIEKTYAIHNVQKNVDIAIRDLDAMNLINITNNNLSNKQ